jgi:hypothetical protein
MNEHVQLLVFVVSIEVYIFEQWKPCGRKLPWPWGKTVHPMNAHTCAKDNLRAGS